MNKQDILKSFGIQQINNGAFIGHQEISGNGIELDVNSPIDNEKLASVKLGTDDQYEQIIKEAKSAFLIWKKVPAPKRGEVIRQIGQALREHKEDLGALVTLEMGKIYQEGLGEVQEMIDICDFAVGLSRQLYGLTMHSERADHRMYEQWHPIGNVGIISSFNFPVAVWAWNAMLALTCGDVCIWKPSEKTPLTAIACQKIAGKVLEENGYPQALLSLIIGNASLGKKIAEDKRIPLVSATGSTPMGQSVAGVVAARLGKTILELGGNNALIITPHADIDLAMTAVVFGAVGTCGQRCTSTRRLIVHSSKINEVKDRLIKAYQKLPIGNPLDATTLVGPLIDEQAVNHYSAAISKVKEQGGEILIGGNELTQGLYTNGNYIEPTIALVKNSFSIVQKETFAPILYLIEYSGEIEEAIEIQNDVKQGLSSAIFSENIKETEKFLSTVGSDCGIANVNIGTSGAEIGGAFGGEKDTGGGRESGSDAWRVYMRRQTNTINYGDELPLAQGIDFKV
jgi:aldehyde dehydrogenase (NAD+)